MLKKLWTVDGLSSAQIARKLGNVTRNACIGKLARLGFTGQGDGARKRAAAPARVPGKPAEPKATRSPARITPAINFFTGKPATEATAKAPHPTVLKGDDRPGRATILTIAFGECRWPIGDPQEAAFTLCGCKAVRASYCEPHAKRAFTSEKTRQWVDAKLAMPARPRFGT